jgi:predicted alpha/beta superfamily hydrolase
MTKHLSPLLALMLAILPPLYPPAQTGTVSQPAARPNVPSVVGELRLHQLKSKVFGNTRVIRVQLPPGYGERANRKKRYQVLYLNDGQNLFDVSTSVFNPLEWQADEALDRLIRAQEIERLKVVIEECAVHNEAAWAKRLPEALKFLYGSPPPNARHAADAQ